VLAAGLFGWFMGERNTTIRSRYFQHRDITLSNDEIVVAGCVRNEALRLPYFLDYYRKLGVTRFLLVDNDSTDGTREYLQLQPDVEYFHTTTSYRGSAAGRGGLVNWPRRTQRATGC
jgi:hypothetical protein